MGRSDDTLLSFPHHRRVKFAFFKGDFINVKNRMISHSIDQRLYYYRHSTFICALYLVFGVMRLPLNQVDRQRLNIIYQINIEKKVHSEMI